MISRTRQWSCYPNQNPSSRGGEFPCSSRLDYFQEWTWWHNASTRKVGFRARTFPCWHYHPCRTWWINVFQGRKRPRARHLRLPFQTPRSWFDRPCSAKLKPTQYRRARSANHLLQTSEYLRRYSRVAGKHSEKERKFPGSLPPQPLRLFSKAPNRNPLPWGQS